MLFLQSNENPFKQEVREYPVDFGYPMLNKYAITIEIPEGYVVESLPPSINIATEENIGTFKYLISNSSGKIVVNSTSTTNQAIVPSETLRQPPLKTQGDERVTAPMYGVLHLTPAPGVATFVQLGDTVKPGQTLCMIEAMKMFHEVKVRSAGRIEAILAASGEEVEAGAELFRLKAVQ